MERIVAGDSPPVTLSAVRHVDSLLISHSAQIHGAGATHVPFRCLYLIDVTLEYELSSGCPDIAPEWS